MRECILRKANEMKQLNDISMKGEIVMFGSTYMAGFPLYELANRCMLEHAIYNRSIEGLTVEEALTIAEDCIVDIKPSKLFLSLGEEDAESPDVLEAYTRLVSMLQKQLPDCRFHASKAVARLPFVFDWSDRNRCIRQALECTFADAL